MLLKTLTGKGRCAIIGNISAFLLGTLIMACSSTFSVGMHANDNGSDPDFDYEQLSEMLEDADAVIVQMRDRKQYDVRNVYVRGDTAMFLSTVSSRLYLVPTSQIRRIYSTDRGRGAESGFAIGLLLGGAAGVAIGALEASSCREDLCGMATIVYPVLGGLVGGLTGYIVGSTNGQTLIYEFSEPSAVQPESDP